MLLLHNRSSIEAFDARGSRIRRYSFGLRMCRELCTDALRPAPCCSLLGSLNQVSEARAEHACHAVPKRNTRQYPSQTPTAGSVFGYVWLSDCVLGLGSTVQGALQVVLSWALQHACGCSPSLVHDKVTLLVGLECLDLGFRHRARYGRSVATGSLECQTLL